MTTITIPTVALGRAALVGKFATVTWCSWYGAYWNVKNAVHRHDVAPYGVFGGLGGGLIGLGLVTEPVATLTIGFVGGGLWKIINDEDNRRRH